MGHRRAGVSQVLVEHLLLQHRGERHILDTTLQRWYCPAAGFFFPLWQLVCLFRAQTAAGAAQVRGQPFKKGPVWKEKRGSNSAVKENGESRGRCVGVISTLSWNICHTLFFFFFIYCSFTQSWLSSFVPLSHTNQHMTCDIQHEVSPHSCHTTGHRLHPFSCGPTAGLLLSDTSLLKSVVKVHLKLKGKVLFSSYSDIGKAVFMSFEENIPYLLFFYDISFLSTHQELASRLFEFAAVLCHVYVRLLGQILCVI